MRLDKIVSDGLLVSRTGAKELIRKGKIFVNGAVCREPDAKIGDDDVVKGEGGVLRRGPLFIMMNKPEGVLSATEDKKCRTAMDLLPEGYKRAKLGIAGRLDKDSCGLLLLTNDGRLNHVLTSPASDSEKTYVVKTDKKCGEREAEAFRQGIDLKEFVCKPAYLMPTDDGFTSVVKITEGKFRQIRRMLASLGRETLFLKRIAMGPLRLDENLGEGEFRELTREEEKKLKNYLGL